MVNGPICIHDDPDMIQDNRWIWFRSKRASHHLTSARKGFRRVKQLHGLNRNVAPHLSRQIETLDTQGDANQDKSTPVCKAFYPVPALTMWRSAVDIYGGYAGLIVCVQHAGRAGGIWRIPLSACLLRISAMTR